MNTEEYRPGVFLRVMQQYLGGNDDLFDMVFKTGIKTDAYFDNQRRWSQYKLSGIKSRF